MTPPLQNRPTALRESDHRRVVIDNKPKVIENPGGGEKGKMGKDPKGKGKGKTRTRPFWRGAKGKKGKGKGEEKSKKEDESKRGRSPTPPRS